MNYFLIIIAYLLGSIPFGLLMARFAGVSDIRNTGSGNIGATNVLRAAGKKLAVLTLLLDSFKGVVTIYLASRFAGGDMLYLAGIACVIGHIFPVWLKFNGGKGVATSFAIILCLVPIVGLIGLLIWVICLGFTRIVSLSVLIAFILAPITSYSLYGINNLFYTILFLSLLVMMRHYQNIMRIIVGKEKKIF